jgi:Immunity protein Imm1
MPPPIHQFVTRAEAIAAFGDSAAAQSCCDDQFVVFAHAVLCFATVGKPDAQPFLGTPTSFVWKPGRLDYDPADQVPWLPTPAREVWGPDREQIKEHHIFLQPPGEEPFAYLGTAHLGSWGGPRGDVAAGFSLNTKVPRDLWLKLGGYPGWEVELNHQTVRVDAGDVTGFRSLLGNLPLRKFGHLTLTRYEEDSLTIHTNALRGWLMYLRSRADSGLYTRDVEYAGGPNAEEFFMCDCGIDLEFPAAQTLPRARAMEVVEEFFATGELPRSVPWAISAGRF